MILDEIEKKKTPSSFPMEASTGLLPGFHRSLTRATDLIEARKVT